jgi:hypothetical protein
MGYRSIVESCIYGDVNKMNVFLVKHKIISSDVFVSFKKDLKITEHTVTRSRKGSDDVEWEHYEEKLKVLHLYGEDWKWYSDYEDVKAWHKLLEEAEKDGLNYEFVRIGEEPDDIEMGNGGENVEGFIEVYRDTASPFND